jgi:methyl-accepting chemotaxis protein
VNLSEPDQLAEQVEATREQLGQTVEELAHRLDVKARATEKVAETKEHVAAEMDSLRQTVQGAGAGAWEQARQAWRRPQIRCGAAAAITIGLLLLRRCLR